MSYALISPPVLRWARLRARLDIDSLADKIKVKGEKLVEWESGEAKPTFPQAQKLAAVLRVPFGYLFLPTPPVEKLPLPDLRTEDENSLNGFSIDLKEVISNVIIKQDWYRDYRKDQEYPELTFIGKYNIDADSLVVARDISKMLKLTIADRAATSNWEEFYRLLVERVEDIGLWVMRSSIVGNNTHRRLSIDEFRGFVISDSIAPAIFINGVDVKAAQIFTLVHELVHLWFNFSGVSNIDFRKVDIQNSHEKKCNEIAAEVLVPKDRILKMWNKSIPISENADKLCKFFKVSSIVIARRAFDLDLIMPEEFFEFYQFQVERWKQQKEQLQGREGGPSYYINIPIVNGRRFSMDVLSSVYSQNMLMRDGAKLLGLNPTTLNKFAEGVGIR